MPGTTARLALAKPLGSESMALGDNQLNDAWTKIDAAMGARIVATTAAVAAPFTGDCAFETTPLQGKCYTGAAWVDTGSNSTPQGSVDARQGSAITNSKVEVKIYDTVFVATAGRQYLVHYQAFLKYPSLYESPQFLKFRWKVGGGGTVIGDTLAETRAFNVPSTNNNGANAEGFFEFFPNVDNNVTLGMWWDPQVLDANNASLGVGNSYSNLEVMGNGV